MSFGFVLISCYIGVSLNHNKQTIDTLQAKHRLYFAAKYIYRCVINEFPTVVIKYHSEK